jgi:hypothetical protein
MRWLLALYQIILDVTFAAASPTAAAIAGVKGFPVKNVATF